MLRVGLIGTGRAGKSHITAFQKLKKSVRLQMISDAAVESAQQVATQCEAQVVASPEEVIISPDIEVVDICVPTFLHREYVLKAAKAGKHVICEKPISLTVEDGQEMIRACKEARVRLFIAHPTRFLPEYRRLKALLDSGKLGQPLVAKARRGGRHFSGVEAWIDDINKSGTIITEAMLHDFDVMRWFFGEVEQVYCAWKVARDPCHLEAAFTTLHFHNGVVAMVEGNRIHNERFYNTIEVFCREGVLAFDRRNNIPIQVTTASFKNNSESLSTNYESPNAFDQFEAELYHFICCIESGRSPVITPEDAVASLAIASAALRSCQSGTVVKL